MRIVRTSRGVYENSKSIAGGYMRTVRAWGCMRTVRASPGVYENIKIITGGI